jgi:hypothetical protein
VTTICQWIIGWIGRVAIVIGLGIGLAVVLSVTTRVYYGSLLHSAIRAASQCDVSSELCNNFENDLHQQMWEHLNVVNPDLLIASYHQRQLIKLWEEWRKNPVVETFCPYHCYAEDTKELWSGVRPHYSSFARQYHLYWGAKHMRCALPHYECVGKLCVRWSICPQWEECLCW